MRYTIREAASIAGVSPAHMRVWCVRGNVQYHREMDALGRPYWTVDAKSLRDYLTRRLAQAEAREGRQ